MRATLAELMDELGVGYELGPYETVPWSLYDSENGITCSAEVRMGPDSDEVDAEIQMMHDNPAEDKPPFERICYLHAAPMGDKKWDVKTFLYRDQPYEPDAYDHSKKSCMFFSSVARALMAGNMPDIEELLDQAFRGGERFAGRGGGGSKAPKTKAGQLMGVKKGGM